MIKCQNINGYSCMDTEYAGEYLMQIVLAQSICPKSP